MLKRIITALVAVVVLVPILWFSNTVIFPVALAVVTLICLFEMFKCMGLNKNVALTFPVYLAAIVFPFLQSGSHRLLSCIDYYFDGCGILFASNW